MKKLFFMTVAAAFALLAFVGCEKDSTEPKVVPPTVEEVTGVEQAYTRGLHEYLEITPEVALSNENEAGVEYEWNINFKVVGNEKTLRIKCDELLSDAACYFKASSANGAKIVDFTLNVTSPYNKGLLLLSQTSEGSILTFKRLDILSTPASPYAFKDNNPGMELGKEALSLCWRGDCLTSPDAALLSDEDYEVVVATGNPTTVYALNTNDMKVKAPIACDFTPSAIYAPAGTQTGVGVWQGALYFAGDGKNHIMASDRSFLTPTGVEILPDGVTVADKMALVGMTDASDYIQVWFDNNSKKLLYMSAIFSWDAELGEKVCDGELMNLMACDGMYYNEAKRYDSANVMAITANGNNVKVYRFSYMMGEELLGEIDATGHILPTSATAVSPVSPILYYSVGGNIYRLNYDNESGTGFDAEPYIALGDNYTVKQLVFNPYDSATLYIAAEKADEQSEMKASLFIYDVSDKSASKQLFADDRVGGTVKQLIYKGNGKEYHELVEGTTSALKRLFR